MLGGGTSQIAFDLEVVPAFSFEIGKWTHLKTKPDPTAPPTGYPAPRKCHSCVQYKTDKGIEVVISGGFYSELEYYKDIWKLSLNTLQWQFFKTTALPNPLYFHDAATSGNGLMYIFGGISVKDSSEGRTNDIYKMWVTVPKLSEVCWEALLHYHPKLPLYSKDVLLEIGVPNKFANRIDRSELKTYTNL